MWCAFCRPLKWMLEKICPSCRSDVSGGRKKIKAWRYGHCNTKQIWADEPEFDAVRDAHYRLAVDPSEALSHLRVLAERGSLWSMTLIGWAYDAGKGVSTDEAEAERWYQLAVAGGCQEAELRLGSFYTRRREFTKAEEIYAIGERIDWAPALYYLACIKFSQSKTPENLRQVYKLFERAAALGDPEAEIMTGCLISRGLFGWRQIPRGVRIMFAGAKKVLGQTASTSR